MRAVIRKVETVTVEVSGDGLPEIQAQLVAQCPDGFDLVSAPVSMKAASKLTATGTFARRDTVREIEGSTWAELQVPDGWQLLYVLND